MNDKNRYGKYLNILNNYISNFNTRDKLISYKINHSYRVANLCVEIGKNLDLSEKELEICYMCGLFHDIGRFEQASSTRTFDDSVYVDHGDSGYEILKNGLIDLITDIEYIKEIIMITTKNHNKLKIGKVKYNQLLFCKIVRDADKLDIFENWLTNIDGKYSMNEKILNCIYKKQCCTEKITNEMDHLIFMICFLFDINFKYSFNYLKENKIVEKKIKLIKDHCRDNTEQLITFINEYLDSQIIDKTNKIFISLGPACRPVHYLKMLGLRQFAAPLDWQSYNLQAAINLYRNDFDSFFKEYKEINCDKEKWDYKYVLDTNNDIFSMHHIRKDKPLNLAVQDFRKLVISRWSEMKKKLNNQSEIIFISNYNVKRKKLENFIIEFDKLFPNHNIKLINIHSRNNGKNNYIYNINERLTIIECFFNDVNKKIESINEWKGNEEKWVENLLLYIK